MSHVGFSGKLYDTLAQGRALHLDTVQFFLGNPQSFQRTTLSDSDIQQCNRLLSEYSMSVFSHFPYVSNLAGSKASLAWKEDAEQNRKTSTLLAHLTHELRTLSKIRARFSGVVIHPGTYPKADEGLRAIIESINLIDFPEGSHLLLENCAGQGATLCGTLAHLQTILHGVREEKRKHLFICIDTCHLFAVGDYDFRSIDEIDRFFEDFDRVIGLNKLKLVHLNDSVKSLGSRVDRHAQLLQGVIWKNNSQSLIYLLRRCKEINVPVCLETTLEDIITLQNLKNEI